MKPVKEIAVFDREETRKAMHESQLQHTVKVNLSLPEGDPELPDEGLPDEIQE